MGRAEDWPDEGNAKGGVMDGKDREYMALLVRQRNSLLATIKALRDHIADNRIKDALDHIVAECEKEAKNVPVA